MGKLVNSTYSSRTYFKGVFVLKREWNVDEAKETYRLYQQHETHHDGFSGATKSLHYVAQGDEEWAEKTAKHYRIEIEQS